MARPVPTRPRSSSRPPSSRMKCVGPPIARTADRDSCASAPNMPATTPPVAWRPPRSRPRPAGPATASDRHRRAAGPRASSRRAASSWKRVTFHKAAAAASRPARAERRLAAAADAHDDDRHRPIPLCRIGLLQRCSSVRCPTWTAPADPLPASGFRRQRISARAALANYDLGRGCRGRALDIAAQIQDGRVAIRQAPTRAGGTGQTRWGCSMASAGWRPSRRSALAAAWQPRLRARCSPPPERSRAL